MSSELPDVILRPAQARLGAAAIEALDAGAFELAPAPAAGPGTLLRTDVTKHLPAVQLPTPRGSDDVSMGQSSAARAAQRMRLP